MYGRGRDECSAITRREFLLASTGAAAGLILLGGCGGSETSEPGGQVTLEFPTWQAEEPGFGDWWKELIAEYQKQHRNVRINMNQVPFEEHTDKLITRFASNSPPELVSIPSVQFWAFADRGWLAPIEDLLKQTDILGNWTDAQQLMVWDGQYQGLLLLTYGYPLYYNEKLLEEAGLTVPETPEELLAAAKATTKDGNFGYGATTTEHPNVFQEASIFLLGQGQNWVKDGKYALTTPEVIEAIEVYRETVKYSPKGVTTEQKRQLFFDGKIAMIIDVPGALTIRDTATEEIKSQVKLALMPFAVQVGQPSYSLHMPATIDEEKKKAAWNFFKLAASREWQTKYVEMTNSPSPRTNATPQELLEDNPDLATIVEASDDPVQLTPTADILKVNFNEFSKIIVEAMLELQTTDKPTPEVLEKLQNTLTSEFRL